MAVASRFRKSCVRPCNKPCAAHLLEIAVAPLSRSIKRFSTLAALNNHAGDLQVNFMLLTYSISPSRESAFRWESWSQLFGDFIHSLGTSGNLPRKQEASRSSRASGHSPPFVNQVDSCICSSRIPSPRLLAATECSLEPELVWCRQPIGKSHTTSCRLIGLKRKVGLITKRQIYTNNVDPEILLYVRQFQLMNHFHAN